MVSEEKSTKISNIFKKYFEVINIIYTTHCPVVVAAADVTIGFEL